ncbi:hypothetical protein B5V02_27620 [Mesorhizobium kowhaii]|uniref:Uncharacterized protein n=2 Tax=Mesorhizobium kowhaii TaxID=1300272 RepID=A0A2W7C0N5_9HYPH|nr:hypothetical protein B5V02_27620 [Mesorhizobium kowhaii]
MVVFMVVGLVIDSWTSGRSESYGLAVRRVEVSPPPSFHAGDKRSASLRRLLANQALQSSEHRLIISLLGVGFSRCGEAADFGGESLRPGIKPHLLVTDPPYGVSYDPAWRERFGDGGDQHGAELAK